MGPARKDFATYSVLCNLGHKLHLGENLCLGDFTIKFQSNAMTEQFMTTFTVAFVGGFIVAFPYVFWEFWRFIKPRSAKKKLAAQGALYLGIRFVFHGRCLRLLYTYAVHG